MKLEEWRFPLANQGETHDEAAQAQDFAAKVLSHAYGDSKPRKRVYVLINPHAGPGGALRKWNAEVKPLFKAAKMSLDEVVLERGGQAAELVERVDVDKYDTIMACSGDGTPHEIFNGLARRADAARALSQVAVSHIPCGSGNAMSCNLYGSHRPSLAALAIIKGVVTSLDLVSITQGDKRFVSFLSQALGIIAESDLATENLRWMGGSRFEVGVMMRLFRKKCYPCDLAVKVEYADKTDVKAHYKRHASDTDYGNNRPAEEAKEAQHGPGLPELKYGTVQDDLPEGWELVQYDKVGNFYCGNVSPLPLFLAGPKPYTIADGLYDLGCKFLLCCPGERRLHGPGHGRRRPVSRQGDEAPIFGRVGQIFRQRGRDIQEGIRIPHYTQRSEGRLHKHRWGEGAV